MSQRVFERVRRVELKLGVEATHLMDGEDARTREHTAGEPDRDRTTA
jgi:hypothetical protein